MEDEIERAIHSRIHHFNQNADSLTLVSVRRLIEEDLGLEKYALDLDVHKTFIRLLMEKLLEDSDDDDEVLIIPVEDVEENVYSSKTESPIKNENKKNLKEPASSDQDKMKSEDSPTPSMGGMTTTNTESVGAADATESKLKKAIWGRASYIIDNLKTISLFGMCRLLEQDLGIPTSALDHSKEFILAQINKVLGSRKKAAARREYTNKSEGMKKRKSLQKEVNVSSKRQKEFAKVPSNEADNNSESADILQSEVSLAKTSKKKQVSTPRYGKHVENLRSIIEACGMSVAPSVYKKAKQVSDVECEAFIIKELEEIPSREGLSTNPQEKEIKEVRKRKERAKEVEGIDLSNILPSSQRKDSNHLYGSSKT